MTSTMRAVVLDAPGPPEALQVRELPIPEPRPGWVLIEVKAFGLNRSELHTRLGLAEGVTFPRVLGIEATGVVAAAPGGEFAAGPAGRDDDGRHGPRVRRRLRRVHLRPRRAGHPVQLRARLGDARRGPRDAADRPRLADRRARRAAGPVAADPRRHVVGRHGRRDPRQGPRPDRLLDDPPRPSAPTALEAIGVDHALDRRRRRRRAGARRSCPTASTSRSSSSAPRRCPTRCARPASTASSASPGCSATSGPCRDFYPIDYLPRGVRLTAYGGDASDLPAEVLQSFLDDVAAGRLTVPIHRTYTLDEIATAHADMEAGNATGKQLVRFSVQELIRNSRPAGATRCHSLLLAGHDYTRG